MDDLKVVFYILIAIGWVIYNNYKKFAEAARKRDPSRAPEPMVEERQPQPTVQIPKPVPARTPRTGLPRKMPLHTSRPRPVKKSRPEPTFLNSGSQLEGGAMTPSKVVQFEEPESGMLYENPILVQLNSAGLRTGFIWSEILKRPYT